MDWEHIRRVRWASAPPPEEWPAGVQPISIEGLALLGLDENGQLYWDGKQVEIRQRLRLTTLQKVGAFVVAVFAVAGGLGSAVQGFTAYNEWACRVGWSATTCPPKAANP